MIHVLMFRLVFLFSCPNNPSINHLNFYCIKQIDNIFPCVCRNRSQKTSQRVKNNSHAARLRLVSYFFVLCKEQKSSVIYYSTHTRKNVIYLFNNIVNCMLSDLYAAEILIINYIFIKVFMKRNFRL